MRNALLVACALAAFAPGLSAQDDILPRAHSSLTLLAANAGLGAITTVVGQVIRGARLNGRKAAQGAVGGVIVFGGKTIVADNRWYANLLGRQIAAAGGSGIQNVASGRRFLENLSFPYGPARLNVETAPHMRVRVKLDLARTGVLIKALSDVHMEMEVWESLLYGVAVFRDSRPDDAAAAGSHVGGVVTFRERTAAGTASDEAIRRTMAHELVHVLQADFSFNTWGGPLERSFLQESEVTRRLHAYFDLGLDVPLASLVNSFVPYSSRPWEREAVSLPKR